MIPTRFEDRAFALAPTHRVALAAVVASTRRAALAPLVAPTRRGAVAVALAVAAALSVVPASAPGQTLSMRARWERLCEIRAEKFDLVLPEAMRENDVDMWITVMREANLDPLWEDLGRGYVGDWAYWIFTDPGRGRVERAVLGADGYMLEECGVYDHFGSASELADYVMARDPSRIAVNMAASIGGADGLSHTSYLHLRQTLGEPYASRLVSAEKLISDFRSRRTALEIGAFAEAGEISREIAERALSNEVITPGETALEDVAWWMWDQLLARGLDSSFDMPSVYITGPTGIEATSSDRIIQRGDLIMIDWGVGFLNLYTDMKRMAYVLREGETEAPASFQRAFDRGVELRDIMKRTIRPGRTARETLDLLNGRFEEAGFLVQQEFNRVTPDDPRSEVIIGAHSVGNWGHGLGPSIAFFNPTRLTYELKPTNLLSIELFAWTPIPEWDGAKLRIPLEDDAVLTERGVEWLYPVNRRILLVR